MTSALSRPARTVFLGSGSFAVPVLEVLAAHPAVELVGVVTAPPRPVGRGGKVTPSAVGACAGAMALPLLTPERLRDPRALEAVERLEPDMIVLADYGQIVPRALLDRPRYGALNLHPSLLPRHRGATPIPAVILGGDRRTGVSLMRMDEGLDTGPLIAVREVPLQGDETAPDLEAVLASVAADLLASALPAWLSGELALEAQSEEGVSLTRPLRRGDGRLDPAQPAYLLERQVRAYQPWPGSFLETDQGRLIVWQSRLPGRQVGGPSAQVDAGAALRDAPAAAPGTLVQSGESLALVTLDGLLELVEVQPGGGRRMLASDLIRGRPSLVGSRVREVALG